MNKIEILSEKEIINEVGDCVSVCIENDHLNIIIKGQHSESLVLINQVHMNTIVTFAEGSVVNLVEFKIANNRDSFSYDYCLERNSKVKIYKLYSLDDYDENIQINLNGFQSSAILNLSVISFGKQLYNISVNHNNKNTVSYIYNHGVTFANGNIEMVVNGFVKNGMKNSELNQENKIMTMGNGKSIIKPNLYIDENMVEARHGASIGRFSDDEIFYLESRGLSFDKCYQLLLKGFLLGNFKLEEELVIEFEKIICDLRR